MHSGVAKTSGFWTLCLDPEMRSHWMGGNRGLRRYYEPTHCSVENRLWGERRLWQRKRDSMVIVLPREGRIRLYHERADPTTFCTGQMELAVAIGHTCSQPRRERGQHIPGRAT